MPVSYAGRKGKCPRASLLLQAHGSAVLRNRNQLKADSRVTQPDLGRYLDTERGPPHRRVLRDPGPGLRIPHTSPAIGVDATPVHGLVGQLLGPNPRRIPTAGLPAPLVPPPVERLHPIRVPFTILAVVLSLGSRLASLAPPRPPAHRPGAIQTDSPAPAFGAAAREGTLHQVAAAICAQLHALPDVAIATGPVSCRRHHASTARQARR